MENFLTPKGFKKFQDELVWRKETERMRIAKLLAAAGEHGDLSENAERVAAEEAHLSNEKRIQELETWLRGATIVESRPRDGVINIGSKITLLLNGKEEIYQLVGSLEADPSKGLISNESPLGRVLLGKKVDQVIEVQTRQGIVRCKIVKVE